MDAEVPPVSAEFGVSFVPRWRTRLCHVGVRIRIVEIHARNCLEFHVYHSLAGIRPRVKIHIIDHISAKISYDTNGTEV